MIAALNNDSELIKVATHLFKLGQIKLKENSLSLAMD